MVTPVVGKKFMARVFQANAELLHIATKAVPVECLNLITIVEKYYGPLRRAFNIVKEEASDFDEEESFQLAVKSIEDIAGPDDLVPTLLVYDAISRRRLSTDSRISPRIPRMSALRKAKTEMTKRFSRSQVLEQLQLETGRTPKIIRTLQSTHQCLYIARS